MKLPKQLQAKLAQAKSCRQLLDERNERGEALQQEDEILQSWHALQRELVKEFLPLVNELAAAGLITLFIEDEQLEPNACAYASVGAFDNGNIWVQAQHAIMFKP